MRSRNLIDGDFSDENLEPNSPEEQREMLLFLVRELPAMVDNMSDEEFRILLDVNPDLAAVVQSIRDDRENYRIKCKEVLDRIERGELP